MARYPQSPLIFQLFHKGQPMVFGKGEIILGNHIEPDGFYYIDTGYVKSYTISDDGDEFLHLIYGHGELFPILWAYLGINPDGVYYESLGDCTVWRISREIFQERLQSSHELSYVFSVQLAQQSRIYSDRINNLEYKRADQRIVYRLLFLAGRFGVNESGGLRINIQLTHETLANSVNLARESVSRQLEALERQQLIRRKGKFITIVDVAGLSSKLSKLDGLRGWSEFLGI